MALPVKPTLNQLVSMNIWDLILMMTFVVLNSILAVMLVSLYLTPPSKVIQSPWMLKPKKMIVFLSLNLGFSLLFLRNTISQDYMYYVTIGILVHIVLSSIFLGFVIRCSKKVDQDRREWCDYEQPRILLPLIFTTILFVWYVLVHGLNHTIPRIYELSKKILKKKVEA